MYCETPPVLLSFLRRSAILHTVSYDLLCIFAEANAESTEAVSVANCGLQPETTIKFCERKLSMNRTLLLIAGLVAVLTLAGCMSASQHAADVRKGADADSLGVLLKKIG